jgi:hypothetical protein
VVWKKIQFFQCMTNAKSPLTGHEQTVPRLENLPARLSVEATASVLGFQVHDVAILVAEKLLSPLGRPAPNAPKYFAKVTVEQYATDVQWLHKATVAVSRYWKRKRSLASSDSANNSEGGE